jgi:general secretion pathway protein D
VYPLRYADAASLVRVLATLLGLPPVPAPPPAPHGSSFMRTAARQAAGRGYDGQIGEPPPVPPATLEATPAGAGTGMPLEAPIRVTADPATNALVVSATPADWETLRPVIEQLDVRRRQVFVEAIILEATLEKTRALGVDFRLAGATGDAVGLVQGNVSPPPSLLSTSANPSSVAGLLLAAASNKMVRLPSGEEVPAQALLLTALETESDVNLLSAPTLVATDNEEAEIIVGQNVPFVASRATSSSNLENLFTTIERQDVGITLRLTPQITGDDFVRLTLFQEVSDIVPGTDVGRRAEDLGPTTTVRSASTAVAARNGQTVVIGGLLADAVRSAERRVPFFGRIPVLGAFFRWDDDRRQKTNLLVFLTPHVLTSDEQVATRALAERERMRAALPPGRRQQPALAGPSWRPPPAAP